MEKIVKVYITIRQENVFKIVFGWPKSSSGRHGEAFEDGLLGSSASADPV